uniref:Filamin binding LIM protein 1 n=1 Tax=Nomascus leucogenys TaxID=61853 RepID=A0A2I3GG78_NOMLE
MASKPEKRVASSVFITLAPPRRDVAVAEEVRQAVCEAQRGRPWEAPAPVKTPEAGLAGRPSPWTPPGRAAATVPAVPLQLSNGGCPPPPPVLDGEDVLPDLDLLPPPPPPPPVLLPSEEEAPAPMGASLILGGLHGVPLDDSPSASPQAPAEGPSVQPGPLRPVEEELPPPPAESVEKGASTDICAFCHKTVSPRELAVEAMKRQYHAQCFTCRTCRRQLAGQSFYQKDGRPLCEPCYQDTLERCGKCGEVVRDHIIRALGQALPRPPASRVYERGLCTRWVAGTGRDPSRMKELSLSPGCWARVSCLLVYYKEYYRAGPGAVAHACNPSTLGGRGGRIM